MSAWLEAIEKEPWRFDFFATLRRLERSHPDKPRIGQNSVLSEEIVAIGQDPFVEFPASNVSDYERTADGRDVCLVDQVPVVLGAAPPAGHRARCA